jgi:hypothetical protein
MLNELPGPLNTKWYNPQTHCIIFQNYSEGGSKDTVKMQLPETQHSLCNKFIPSHARTMTINEGGVKKRDIKHIGQH